MTNSQLALLIIRESRLKVAYLRDQTDANLQAWLKVRDQLRPELTRRQEKSRQRAEAERKKK